MYFVNNVPLSFFPGTKKYYIFEGLQEGEGDLALVIKLNGNEICKQRVHLTLRDIDTFYRKWQVEADENTNRVIIPSSVGYVDTDKYKYKPRTDDLVVYVHGWNMQDYEKRRWAETVFKRLWWQGYKGHVSSLDWPTLWFTGDIPPLANYDRSDFRAYQTGNYLKMIIEWLETTPHAGKIRILAHSMGNQVVGEALRRLPDGEHLHSYVASQAAVSAHAYDSSLPDDAYFAPLTGPRTPEVIRHYFSGIMPDNSYYAGNITKVSQSRIFRFFNVDDYAFTRTVWQLNNYTKPDNSYHYSGSSTSYDQNADRFYYDSFALNDERTLFFEQDRYEIFAFCAESRANTLGAVAGPVIGMSEFNLNDALGYNREHYSHSRQFRSNIVSEDLYWSQFLISCGLTK